MDAIQTAVAMLVEKLAKRNYSEAELADFLAAKAIDDQTAAQAIEHLKGKGLIRDVAVLDALISKASGKTVMGDLKLREVLDRRGFSHVPLDSLEELPSEKERARAVVRSVSNKAASVPKIARMLVSRGFTPETVESVVSQLDESIG